MKKRGVKKNALRMLFISFILITALIFLIKAIPSFNLISQNPADINTLNLYSSGANISDIGEINATVDFLYFKSNTTASDNYAYINGTPFSGFKSEIGGINQAPNWTFNLDDNDIYPIKLNIDQDVMENTRHSIVSLISNNAVKIEFLNVSGSTQYNLFEFMANSTIPASSLFIFYCNSTYVSGDVTTNKNCIQFGSIAGTSKFNITNPELNSSKYQLVTMIINTTTKKVSNFVQVTPTSYFVLQKSYGFGSWNVYNIAKGSRKTASATSTNNGGIWTPQTYTIDAHLHQYDGTDTFYYYICSNDIFGNSNCSALRSDLLHQAGMPPSVPHVYIPTTGNYKGIINISYIAAISPNNYPISSYSISLTNLDETYNKTIIANNLLNLNYPWDTTGTPDGNYLIKVVAKDNLGQTSFDLSNVFTIDNEIPPKNNSGNLFWIEISAIVLASLLIIFLLIKNVKHIKSSINQKWVEKEVSKPYIRKPEKKIISGKLQEIKDLKQKAKKLMEEAKEKEQKEAREKIKRAAELRENSYKLIKEAKKICKNCKVKESKK